MPGLPPMLGKFIKVLETLEKGATGMDIMEGMAKNFFGKNFKGLGKLLNILDANQKAEMEGKIGKQKFDFINKNNNQNKGPKFIETPDSSWVESLDWKPSMSTCTLKVRDNDKVYKLPFFPRSILTSIEGGASAGKTIWRKYWRVFGKGKVSNKLKNKVRVETTKKAVKIINSKLPTFKVTKRAPQKTFKKNLIKKVTIKTSNIPGTGAKGVKITIKTPKIRKY